MKRNSSCVLETAGRFAGLSLYKLESEGFLNAVVMFAVVTVAVGRQQTGRVDGAKEFEQCIDTKRTPRADCSPCDYHYHRIDNSSIINELRIISGTVRQR